MQSREDFNASPLTELAYLATSFGHGAVLIFFVLSGYFVGGSVIKSARSGRFDPTRYAVSRLVRLWIVMLPALVLTAVADRVGRAIAADYYFYDRHSNATDYIGTALFLQGSIVGLPGTNDALWSLAFEAFYYAMFPLIIIGLRTGGPIRRVMMLAVVVGIFILASPLIWLLFPVWLMGAAVAYWEAPVTAAVRSLTATRLAVGRVLAIVLVGVGLLLDRATEVRYDGATAGSYVLGLFTSLLIALLLVDVEPRVAIGRRILRCLSRYAHSSYSLYAIHMPLLALIVAIVNPVSSRSQLWVPGVITWLGVASVVAILVACGGLFAAATESHTDRVRRGVLAASRRRGGHRRRTSDLIRRNC